MVRIISDKPTLLILQETHRDDGLLDGASAVEEACPKVEPLEATGHKVFGGDNVGDLRPVRSSLTPLHHPDFALTVSDRPWLKLGHLCRVVPMTWIWGHPPYLCHRPHLPVSPPLHLSKTPVLPPSVGSLPGHLPVLGTILIFAFGGLEQSFSEAVFLLLLGHAVESPVSSRSLCHKTTSNVREGMMLIPLGSLGLLALSLASGRATLKYLLGGILFLCRRSRPVKSLDSYLPGRNPPSLCSTL